MPEEEKEAEGTKKVYLKNGHGIREEGKHKEGVFTTNNNVLVKELIGRRIGRLKPWPGQNKDGSYSSAPSHSSSSSGAPVDLDSVDFDDVDSVKAAVESLKTKKDVIDFVAEHGGEIEGNGNRDAVNAAAVAELTS